MGLDAQYCYTTEVGSENHLHYFNIDITQMAKRFRRHFGGGRAGVQNMTDNPMQEELFAAELYRAELLLNLGIYTDWIRRGYDYLQINTPERYRRWHMDHLENSNEFLEVLIEKQKAKKEREL